jgi:hypothetical protein
MDIRSNPLNRPLPLPALTTAPQKPPSSRPVSPLSIPQDVRFNSVSVGQAAGTLSFVEPTPSASPPETDWALALEHKVQQGYRPTPAETFRYHQVAAALEARQSDPRQAVREALALEARVKTGYRPTSAELQAYRHTAQALFKADQEPVMPAVAGVSPPEMEWASALSERVRQFGYRPSDQELEAYNQIYARWQQALAQQSPPVTPAEQQWATQLEQRVQQGYPASEREIHRYNDIYLRQQGQSEISAGDLAWVMRFRQSVATGYQPGAAELAQYGELFEKACLQDASLIQPAENPVSLHELEWARRLQASVQQGIAPSEADIRRYQEIYARYEQSP